MARHDSNPPLSQGRETEAKDRERGLSHRASPGSGSGRWERVWPVPGTGNRGLSFPWPADLFCTDMQDQESRPASVARTGVLQPDQFSPELLRASHPGHGWGRWGGQTSREGGHASETVTGPSAAPVLPANAVFPRPPGGPRWLGDMCQSPHTSQSLTSSKKTGGLIQDQRCPRVALCDFRSASFYGLLLDTTFQTGEQCPAQAARLLFYPDFRCLVPP